MSPAVTGIYALMFLASVLLLEGFTQLLLALRNPQQKAINRRLRLLESGYDPDEIYRLLRRRAGSEGWLGLPLISTFNGFLQQAGVTLSMASVVVVIAVVALVVTAVGIVGFGLDPALAALIAVGGVVAATVVFLSTRRRRRLNALERQLPDLLDLIVRSVRSGHPLNTALRLAANEVPEPLGSEIGLVVDETTYGVSLVDAVDHLAVRVGVTDYAYFAVVVKITGTTGGNLAAILDNLATIMRDRTKMRRKILAISAEGRISGLVMSMAPVCISGLIMLTAPGFFLEISNDPLFEKLIWWVAFLIIGNYLVLRRLVNFEI